MNAETALGHVEAKDILEAFEHGATIPVQAKALGVTHQAIYRKLIKDAPEQWKEHQAAKALAKLDDVEDKLEQAVDGVAVSRERELARLHMWKLERVLRRIYGTDAPAVQINVNIGDIAGKIKDLEAELLSVPHTVQSEQLAQDRHSTDVTD